MSQKRFVVTDMHGAYKALLQVMERSGFNYKKDLLICTGDTADGWSQVADCFEELLKVKHLVYVMGNHDFWLLQWFTNGASPMIWTSQGGKASIECYLNYSNKAMAKRHEELLGAAEFYHVTEDNKLFVHGGFNWQQPIEIQDGRELMWDRYLYDVAIKWEVYNRVYPDEPRKKFDAYDEIFIGHTSTSWKYKDMLPVHVSNVWNLDQGAGYEGKLTMMNIDTKEFWQSDLVSDLYPNEKGRR